MNPNPVALGSRWIAYAERKLLPAKRSYGGCDRDAVPSYKATVLNAAKSIGKGLLELTEQMTTGFGGTSSNLSTAGAQSSSADSANGAAAEEIQSGVVTILDTRV